MPGRSQPIIGSRLESPALARLADPSLKSLHGLPDDVVKLVRIGGMTSGMSWFP
jgi:hypothetical protein